MEQEKWPTSSGYNTMLRVPLRPKKVTEIMEARGKFKSADHLNSLRVLQGGALLSAIAVSVMVMGTLFPNLEVRYGHNLLEILLSPVEQAIRYGLVGGLLLVAVYLLVFNVLRRR